jgi:hypothetical protein
MQANTVAATTKRTTGLRLLDKRRKSRAGLSLDGVNAPALHGMRPGLRIGLV